VKDCEGPGTKIVPGSNGRQGKVGEGGYREGSTDETPAKGQSTWHGPEQDLVFGSASHQSTLNSLIKVLKWTILWKIMIWRIFLHHQKVIRAIRNIKATMLEMLRMVDLHIVLVHGLRLMQCMIQSPLPLQSLQWI
jgi:hypothetical protein